MSRAVIHERYGGPEVLQVRDIPEPHVGPGQLRVRVTAAGLNPVDWEIVESPELAREFGVATPSGFGNDFAGVVDEVGERAGGFAVGDRVYGGARGHAVADHAVVQPGLNPLFHTPPGVDDGTAATLLIAGRTADAAISVIGVRAGDTVLLGGGAGGVGVFAVQLALRAGARVIATGSESSSQFLHDLGATPVVYGDGLIDRLRDVSSGGITAAADLFGTEAAEAALKLGVPPARISTIAAAVPPPGTHAVGGTDATPGALERIAAAIAAGEFRVPIAAVFPIERIKEAVEMQRARHTHGKIIISMEMA